MQHSPRAVTVELRYPPAWLRWPLLTSLIIDTFVCDSRCRLCQFLPEFGQAATDTFFGWGVNVSVAA